MAHGGKRDFDLFFKLLLIGDSGVGKSCLLLRFIEDSFSTTFISTLGIDFKIKTVECEGKRVKLQIWDTAGQERFRTITSAFYRGATGILLVYDVCDEASFANVRHWMKQVQQHASEHVQKIILANKADIAQRRVATYDGHKLANEYGVPYFETSAKSNINVTEAFMAFVQAIKKKADDPNNPLHAAIAPPPTPLLQRENSNKTQQNCAGCCAGSRRAAAALDAAADDSQLQAATATTAAADPKDRSHSKDNAEANTSNKERNAEQKTDR
jgi:Ras-related protein Rab-8A